MHIPASMLHGNICPVTLGVGAAGVVMTAYAAAKAKVKPSTAKFAAITALIFALQMLNFPVQNGTSGHLIGGMLAVTLLGVPFAALAVSLVLAVQAIFFGDGGLNALGANIINMAFIGTVLGGFIFNMLRAKKFNKQIAIFCASWFSVVLAAVACSFEIALSGAVQLNKAIMAMAGVHALIGIGEAAITAAVVGILGAYAATWQKNEKAFALGGFVLAAIAALVSPLASRFPDGLEYVADKLNFAKFSGFNFPVLFTDYRVAFISGEASTIVAGLIGVVLTGWVAYFVSRFLQKYAA